MRLARAGPRFHAMSESPRSVYRLARPAGIDRPLLPGGLCLRTVTDADDGSLATLMEQAYAGTVDEQLGGNSDGAVEMANWRAGTPLAEVSVIVVDADDHVVAASLCSGSWDGEVWISYVITDPAWKGQGLGTAVVTESVRQLRQRAEVDVFAGVTDGNLPSERLLAAVGFERVGPI
jgi:ribosomal protein S18 acetylase RimI-like enzyme